MPNNHGNIRPAPAGQLGSLLRNPLVIFGLIFLAGDGPLATSYIFTSDPVRAYVLLIAMIVFIFGMGIFFCYLVAFKPRHLYSPTEFPKETLGQSIYNDTKKEALEKSMELANNLLSESNGPQRSEIVEDLSDKLEIAYQLLLIPGYDLSLISDILEGIDRDSTIDLQSISNLRNITPSTIAFIVHTMIKQALLIRQEDSLSLTEKGQELLVSLRHHLRP